MTTRERTPVRRFGELPVASPAARLRLRPGTLRDYAALAEFHYRHRRPATVSRVLSLVDDAPAVGERAERLGMRRQDAAKDAGAGDGRVVAVLVESRPVLNCALRDAALGDRYRAASRADAARLLNREVRCISRVVVHPQWRGLGLAVRLVREALATMRTRYTEALAAMGRVHPFFERAGMTAYRRWPHRRDQRLIDALRLVGVEPWELASATRVRRHLDGDDTRARVLGAELRRWGGSRRDVDEAITEARQRLLCDPVYYLASCASCASCGVSRD